MGVDARQYLLRLLHAAKESPRWLELVAIPRPESSEMPPPGVLLADPSPWIRECKLQDARDRVRSRIVQEHVVPIREACEGLEDCEVLRIARRFIDSGSPLDLQGLPAFVPGDDARRRLTTIDDERGRKTTVDDPGLSLTDAARAADMKRQTLADWRDAAGLPSGQLLKRSQWGRALDAAPKSEGRKRACAAWNAHWGASSS